MRASCNAHISPCNVRRRRGSPLPQAAAAMSQSDSDLHLRCVWFYVPSLCAACALCRTCSAAEPLLCYSTWGLFGWCLQPAAACTCTVRLGGCTRADPLARTALCTLHHEGCYGPPASACRFYHLSAAARSTNLVNQPSSERKQPQCHCGGAELTPYAQARAHAPLPKLVPT